MSDQPSGAHACNLDRGFTPASLNCCSDFVWRGNFDALAILLAEHLIGPCVVGEAVGRGIELQRPAVLVCDVAQVRQGGGGVGGLDRSVLVGGLAATNRFDEVLVVPGRRLARSAGLVLASEEKLILGVAADDQVASEP